MNTRIKQILDHSGLNQQEFAERIAIAPATLSNILNGRVAKYSTDLVMSIVSAFPDVNPMWLLSGKGEMMQPGSGDSTGSGMQGQDGSDATASAEGNAAQFGPGGMFPEFAEGLFPGASTIAYNSPTPGTGAENATGRKAGSGASGSSARQTGMSGGIIGAVPGQIMPGMTHRNGTPVTVEEYNQMLSHFSAMNIAGNGAVQATKIIDKPVRKIKEIRVFFDDDTFEVFSPYK